jgi:hypothetical protein
MRLCMKSPHGRNCACLPRGGRIACSGSSAVLARRVQTAQQQGDLTSKLAAFIVGKPLSWSANVRLSGPLADTLAFLLLAGRNCLSTTLCIAIIPKRTTPRKTLPDDPRRAASSRP